MLKQTDINLQCYGPGVNVPIVLPTDSISLVCGDTTGLTFCGDRLFSVWEEKQNTEHNLQTSPLFKISDDSSFLTLFSFNRSYVGINKFILKAKLADYP